MQSKARTVAQYLAELPEDRRRALEAVRQTILANLDPDYEEGMQYGMIGYYVPHRVFPAGYHCDPRQPLPFAALSSQKNHMGLGLMSHYSDPRELKWFVEQWARTGKKLDMGKVCIRFKKLDDLPLEVIGEAIRRIPARAYVAHYEAARAAAATARGPRKPAARKTAVKNATRKKAAAKKTAAKKTARAAGRGRRTSRSGGRSS